MKSLCKQTLERHQPLNDRGYLLFLTPLSFFDPQQRSFQSILVGTPVQPVFQQTKPFYSFLLPYFCQSRADRATAVQAERQATRVRISYSPASCSCKPWDSCLRRWLQIALCCLSCAPTLACSEQTGLVALRTHRYRSPTVPPT